MSRLYEKALDCCDSVDEEVLLNVFLHGRRVPCLPREVVLPLISRLGRETNK